MLLFVLLYIYLGHQEVFGFSVIQIIILETSLRVILVQWLCRTAKIQFCKINNDHQAIRTRKHFPAKNYTL